MCVFSPWSVLLIYVFVTKCCSNINNIKLSGSHHLKNAKNIIDELDNLVPVKNKHTVIEARALHVISSAVNLIESIRANYSNTVAEELSRRLIKSILSEDPQKFQRKLGQIRKQENTHGKQ